MQEWECLFAGLGNGSMPFIPPWRQSLEDLWIREQPVLQIQFLESRDYKDQPFLNKTRLGQGMECLCIYIKLFQTCISIEIQNVYISDGQYWRPICPHWSKVQANTKNGRVSRARKHTPLIPPFWRQRQRQRGQGRDIFYFQISLGNNIRMRTGRHTFLIPPLVFTQHRGRQRQWQSWG